MAILAGPAGGQDRVPGLCRYIHPGREKADEHFAFQFKGFVEIPRAGIYSFYTVSDDGSMLYIGHQAVVSNDYLQGMTERKGQIALKAGYHPINVQYFNATGAMGLEVYYEGPGIPRQRIPTVVLK